MYLTDLHSLSPFHLCALAFFLPALSQRIHLRVIDVGIDVIQEIGIRVKLSGDALRPAQASSNHVTLHLTAVDTRSYCIRLCAGTYMHAGIRIHAWTP